MSDSVLVSGATGVLGTEICRLLRASDHEVRALVRAGSSSTDVLADLGCDFATGDLLDPASLRQACVGVSQVVNTATSIATLRKGQKMSAIDRDGILSLVAAAEEAGVGNFVFTSIAPTAADIQFFRYKRIVEKRLRESAMRATILQPGAFMDSGFDPANGWDVAGGTVKMLGSGKARTPWVAIQDVAKAAVAVVTNPELQGRDWPIAGPESLNHVEALAVFEEVYGRSAKVQRIPAWVVRGLGKVVRPFREDLASVMDIITADLEAMTVETAPELRVHLEPMVTVRDFAERQKADSR